MGVGSGVQRLRAGVPRPELLGALACGAEARCVAGLVCCAMPGRGEAWGGGWGAVLPPHESKAPPGASRVARFPLDEDGEKAERLPDCRMPVGRKLCVHILLWVSQSLALVENRLSEACQRQPD